MTDPTLARLKLTYQKIVSRSSAVVPGQIDVHAFGLARDHLGLVKFSSEEDGEYQDFSNQLIKLFNKPYTRVFERWAKWDHEISQ